MENEMKIITIIILGIILTISLVSAVSLYSGESYSFESEQFDYYEVIGNSSSMEGMEISWENGNTTIDFDILFKPDNFTLIFWKDNEIIVKVPSDCPSCSGGGTRTIYEDKNVTIYKDKIIKVPEYINQTIPCDEPKSITYNLKKIFLGFWLLFLIICLIWYFKNQQDKKSKKPKHN